MDVDQLSKNLWLHLSNFIHCAVYTYCMLFSVILPNLHRCKWCTQIHDFAWQVRIFWTGGDRQLDDAAAIHGHCYNFRSEIKINAFIIYHAHQSPTYISFDRRSGRNKPIYAERWDPPPPEIGWSRKWIFEHHVSRKYPRKCFQLRVITMSLNVHKGSKLRCRDRCNFVITMSR